MVPRAVAWRLGWRFLRVKDRRQLLSMALVVVGVGLAVLSVLCSVAAFTVNDARAERTVNRAFLDTRDPAAIQAWVHVNRMTYGDRNVLRVDIALTTDPLSPPPGVPRWPTPGDRVVSAAFASTAAGNPVLNAYAPGRTVGTVAEPGLRSPDELVVYRGVHRDQLPQDGSGLGVAERRGEPTTALWLDRLDMPGGQVAALVAMVMVCLGLPLVAFLSVAARLSASTRARRLAALHLLGVPARTIRRINAVEFMLLALLGAAWALAVYPPVNVVLAGSNLVGITWFPTDTALTPATAGVVVLAMVVLAGFVTRRVEYGAHAGSARTRRGVALVKAPIWRLLPLGIGVAVLIGQVIAGFLRPAGQPSFLHLNLVMLLAVAVTGVGVLLSITPLTRAVGRLAQRSGRSLATRIGGARAAFDPAATARLVAGLAILVFAVGVTIGQTRDARAVSEPTGATVDIFLYTYDIPSPTAGMALLGSGPSPAVAEASTDPGKPSVVSAIVADCAQIGRFLGTDAATSGLLDGCRPETAYWSSTVPPADRSLRGLPIPDAQQAVVSPGTMPAEVSALLDTADVLITLPSQAVYASDVTLPADPRAESGATEYSDTRGVLIRAPRDSVNATLAHVYTIAPYSQPSAFGINPDSGENIAMINGYIRLGLLGGVLMALLALTTALADRVTERRGADHELLAGGAPRTLVRRAHQWEVAITLAGSLTVAAVAGILGGLAWQLAGGLNRTPDVVSIAGLLVMAAVVGGLATLGAAAAAPRRLELAALRRG